MVQRLSELDGVDQSLAVPVSPILLDQIRTGEHERRDPAAAFVKTDVGKPPAATQVKRPAKDVGCLKRACHKKSPPLKNNFCHQNVSFITN
jgi:hypothetical protein